MPYLGASKYCPQCHTYKPMATAFSKSKSTPDGLHAWCKECRRASRLKYKNRNDRFWKSYQRKTVKVGSCTEWTGKYNSKGFPVIQWNKKGTTVRRIVYMLGIGDLTDDDRVIVTCKNRRCVGQPHLKKVSQSEQLMTAQNLASDALVSKWRGAL